MTARRLRWILAGCSTLFALLVGLVAAELFLGRTPAGGGDRRTEGPQVTRHDPQLGWSPRPLAQDWHETPEFRVPVRINAHGFRSDREYAFQPPPGVRRIVAVGDSFTFGHGVKVDESFPAVLERGLPGTEVVNLAVSGYGVDQQLLMLSQRGFRYQPDVVLLGFYIPDIFRTDDLYHGRYAKPRYELRRDGELVLTNVPVPELAGPPPPPQGLARSRVYRLVQSKLEYRGFGDAWDLTEAILKRMNEETAAAGARLVAVIIPTEQAVYGGGFDRWLQAQTTGKAAGLLRRHGIEHLDLTPVLLAEAERSGERLYFPKDGHLTAEGHAVVGRAVVRHLAEGAE
ncbi:MAG TPA: GDSL-type esterase/lipase family protein [Thermoanaerobaculia bacterium]|nr:GDSL-type esterase/lipase family protein [Thermoanaerobaculia bacterium]